MVLLVQKHQEDNQKHLQHLHSTMVLLVLRIGAVGFMIAEFTFHYGSISTLT